MDFIFRSRANGEADVAQMTWDGLATRAALRDPMRRGSSRNTRHILAPPDFDAWWGWIWGCRTRRSDQSLLPRGPSSWPAADGPQGLRRGRAELGAALSRQRGRHVRPNAPSGAPDEMQAESAASEPDAAGWLSIKPRSCGGGEACRQARPSWPSPPGFVTPCRRRPRPRRRPLLGPNCACPGAQGPRV